MSRIEPLFEVSWEFMEDSVIVRLKQLLPEVFEEGSTQILNARRCYTLQQAHLTSKFGAHAVYREIFLGAAACLLSWL